LKVLAELDKLKLKLKKYEKYRTILKEIVLGLKDVRKKAIDCLKGGRVQHDTDRSGNIDEKNLLVTGQITVDEVIELINATKGTQFETSNHHSIIGLEVHVFSPKGWYIKCYFIEPDVFFISVHK